MTQNVEGVTMREVKSHSAFLMNMSMEAGRFERACSGGSLYSTPSGRIVGAVLDVNGQLWSRYFIAVGGTA